MKTVFAAGFLACLISIVSVSCKKDVSGTGGNNNVPPGQSAVHLFLTDDPSLVFDNVFIDIQKVEIKVEDSDEVRHESEHEGEADDNDHHGDTSGGWIPLPVNPGVYDILQFRNGLDTLFANGSFPSNLAFKKIRITLGTNNSVVFNGQTFPLTLKNDDRFVVIKLEDFSINGNSSSLVDIWMDFDAGQSIRQHGNSFELRPQIRPFTKENAGEIEGRVSPAAANAIVMAIKGTDTLTAKPEAEGEFRFVGLNAGTYSLLFHATANNYQDSTLTNIQVSVKEDTKVPTVTLHQ